MVAQKGKDLLIKLDMTGAGEFETVAGLRATRITFNADTVDVDSQYGVRLFGENTDHQFRLLADCVVLVVDFGEIEFLEVVVIGGQDTHPDRAVEECAANRNFDIKSDCEQAQRLVRPAVRIIPGEAQTIYQGQCAALALADEIAAA